MDVIFSLWVKIMKLIRNILRNNLLSIECFTFCNNTLVNNFGFVKELYTISISNILKDYWNFPSEFNNALYEFFQEEIFPRKSL